MCENCRPFCVPVELTNADGLNSLLDRLYDDGLNPDVLEVIDGSLQWSDVVDCTLRCTSCGQRFRLACETYHGGGGRFEIEMA